MILGEIDCLPIKEFSLTFNEWKGLKNWAEPVIGKIDDYEDEISMKKLASWKNVLFKELWKVSKWRLQSAQTRVLIADHSKRCYLSVRFHRDQQLDE